MSKSYSDLKIQVLTSSQAIRKRASMYVGPTDDPKTLTKLIVEAMCIARSYVADNKASRIDVVVSGSEVIVSDNGPGISLEKNEKNHDLTLLETLLTQLSACKNLKHETVKHFCDNGIVVVNSLSEFFYV